MINKTLIFLHIPKTGGRSLQKILLRNFKDKEVITDGHEKLEKIKSWPDESRRKIRYIQGHFIYGVHELFSQESTYITMLRDPVERVISHYYYIRRSPNHPLHATLRDENIDLVGYINSGVCGEVQNDQTRLVAGVPRDSGVAPDDMLRMAKENIEGKFILAGVIEKFDESLMLLKKELGLGNIFYGVRNQTIGRPLKEQVPAETLDLIKESNRLDIALYAHVEQILDSKIHAGGLAFRRGVKGFQLINKPYSRLFYGIRKLKNALFRN